MYYHPTYNWMYYSEPEPELAGRRIYAPRGKVQGGSGSINAMIYVRGQPHDFDDWAAAGNDGWAFKDVLPYFRKLESHPLGESEYHGASGPIHISPMKGQTHAICDAFIEGCQQLGYPAARTSTAPTSRAPASMTSTPATASAAPAASPTCTRHWHGRTCISSTMPWPSAWCSTTRGGQPAWWSASMAWNGSSARGRR